MPFFRSSRDRDGNQQLFSNFDKPHHQKYFYLSRLTIITLMLICGSVILHKPIFLFYGDWLTRVDENATADLAVVMGVGKPRLQAALQLFEEKKVEGIFLNSMTKARFESLVEKHSLPREHTYWGGCGATNTYSQPYFFLESYGKMIPEVSSIVIVTSPFHVRRARWSYQHILDKAEVSVEIKTYAAPGKKWRKNINWWQYQNGRDWVSYETQKNLFYRYYYGLLNKPSKDIPYHNFFDQEGTQTKPIDIEDNCNEASF